MLRKGPNDKIQYGVLWYSLRLKDNEMYVIKVSFHSGSFLGTFLVTSTHILCETNVSVVLWNLQNKTSFVRICKVD